MILALAGTVACRDITLSSSRVIALQVDNTTPTVEQGDTLRLTALPLNAAGQAVSGASVTWTVVDTGVTGFRLDPSGLVHATAPDTGRIQATADALRSDPLTLIVTAVPDTAAPAGPVRIIVPGSDVKSGSMTVSVYHRSDTGALSGILGKRVIYQVAAPSGSTGFFLTVSDSVPGTDPRRVVTQTGSGGQATAIVRRRPGEAAPDSVLVDATAQTAQGVTVPGTPVRFTVVLQ